LAFFFCLFHLKTSFKLNIYLFGGLSSKLEDFLDFVCTPSSLGPFFCLFPAFPYNFKDSFYALTKIIKKNVLQPIRKKESKAFQSIRKGFPLSIFSCENFFISWQNLYLFLAKVFISWQNSYLFLAKLFTWQNLYIFFLG